jgi:hypothetical protein
VGLLLLGVDEGMLESDRIFRWRLHYCIMTITAVALNTSCND